jgi:hypothetical protein
MLWILAVPAGRSSELKNRFTGDSPGFYGYYTLWYLKSGPADFTKKLTIEHGPFQASFGEHWPPVLAARKPYDPLGFCKSFIADDI